MKKELNDIIENSKKMIEKSFFRIVKNDDSYKIIEYFGPSRSLNTMMYNGWNRHTYLTKYINEDYPFFNLNDFKSVDGIKIEKIDDNDKLKEQLNEYIKYFKMNIHFYEDIKNLKKFLTQFNVINVGRYQTFTDLKNDFLLILNNYTSNIIEKQKYTLILFELVNSIYMNLEKLNIENSHLFFEENFKYFISLVK